MKRPWLAHYGKVAKNLEYFQGSMVDAVIRKAKEMPQDPALSFMEKKISYWELEQKIEEAARAFAALGVKKGDRVALCLPNLPQTIYCLYGLNRLGAIAVMIHPLSAEKEIVYYLKESDCSMVITLRQFYEKLQKVEEEIALSALIITDLDDCLKGLKKWAYRLGVKSRFEALPSKENLHLWPAFIKAGKGAALPNVKALPQEGAVALFSGGTTGAGKGILLSNLNFNALAQQTVAMCAREVRGKRMLAAMPMFHGFGLGVCVHTMLMEGGCAILVPRFNVAEYAKLIRKERPNYIAGVPTLFEALLRTNHLEGADLSCLMGVFSGGDSLSVELKKKMDRFLADHGATVRIREGYGTTECVTASCLTPDHEEREGSIGLPYPDMDYKICKVGSTQEVAFGQEGEICLAGPTLMLGYLGHPEETAQALQTHEDGRIWLHTGDLGMMDEDGFIYFKQRLKRIIITNGYNVYPSQIENILDGHEKVQVSCVVGIPDSLRGQKVKAYIVAKEGILADEALQEELLDYCRAHIARYALPREWEFREDLPKTLVGKVDYKKLS